MTKCKKTLDLIFEGKKVVPDETMGLTSHDWIIQREYMMPKELVEEHQSMAEDMSILLRCALHSESK